jgi:hypothetical protein
MGVGAVRGLAEVPPPVVAGPGGRLEYRLGPRGDQLPDFSFCGFRNGDEPVPVVEVRARVAPGDGDDTGRVQAAIDYVSGLAPGPDGFRGAVLLEPGEFEVAGQLAIRSSGVVLRGSGKGMDGTTVTATGPDRRPLVLVSGEGEAHVTDDPPRQVANRYVPAGSRELVLVDASGFAAGDEVLVRRPSAAEWIAALGMDQVGPSWKPGSRDLVWERRVAAVEGAEILFDVPLTGALDAAFGGATVTRFAWPGRVERVGVENLILELAPGPANRFDEDHAWLGVSLEKVRDAWVRRVRFSGFAGSAVAVWESARNVTVRDCEAFAPVSEAGGFRRRTFYCAGQMALFLRCWSEHGRNDFAVGHLAAGPNAFVACHARSALGSSGALGSWASGVLFDNVTIDGGGLHLENRWNEGQGAGWAAGDSLLWQCSASAIRCSSPPGAPNWAVGVWGEYAGDGNFSGKDEFASPASLYRAQVGARLGAEATERLGFIESPHPSSTNPGYGEANSFVRESDSPRDRLLLAIWAAPAYEPVPVDPGDAKVVEPSPPPAGEAPEPQRLELVNGWLAVGGRLKVGITIETAWWRGSVRPDEAARSGPALTRFVPGRTGPGLTDDLDALAARMARDGQAVFEHHHGLWYDRRRDDHQMVRRASAEVEAPFFEMPFARSGEGTAWDGLSLYDLGKYNPWYWNRLEEFAAAAAREGVVLVHQHYFQHNLLEAGAHWADFPWRSANNANRTGFPEPPPYIGDKRVFQAHLFYDLGDPEYRALHQAYLRQCLALSAGSPNVVHSTSAEFTGPLGFVEFWIDTAVEWERETRTDALLALSATKDVQDAVLADPGRAAAVSVIDLRYWTYLADGSLYAPGGGLNLSPRQHLRLLKPGPASFESVLRGVREYRTKFPDKAITFRAGQHCPGVSDGWAMLMGGGSFPDVPTLPGPLLEGILRMRPADRPANGPGTWSLADAEGNALVYTTGPAVTLELGTHTGTFQADWIDPHSGELVAAGRTAVEAGGDSELVAVTPVLWLRR